MHRNIIHITGASGSGTTTLARAISAQFGYTHLDTDDFFWEQTDPPFTQKREAAKRQQLLGEAIDQAERCVISGSLSGWGDVFIPRFDLVIYVVTPVQVRIQRLQQRELGRFGDRILPGGDMFAHHQAFLQWAAAYDTGGMEMRSALYHREWLKQMTCPVARVDGTEPAEKVLEMLSL